MRLARDYTYLCVDRTAGMPPISALLGFHTPSAAEPFGECPANYSKVLGNGTSIGSNDLNHGSNNPGAMFQSPISKKGRLRSSSTS